TILEQAKRAGVGHIGSALSVADIIAALYSGGMDISDPDAPNRDRLVLSKGHAALALYAALHQRAWLTREELNPYCEDGSLLDLEPMDRRWDAFGWDARVVDGHDVGAMLQAFDDLDPVTGPPHVLVARTTFGRGVSFMENQIRWHYFPMSDQEYARAVDEVR